METNTLSVVRWMNQSYSERLKAGREKGDFGSKPLPHYHPDTHLRRMTELRSLDNFTSTNITPMNQPIVQKPHFNEVLEMAESLSDTEQHFLIEILQKRSVEKRRKQIAESISEAHAEYKTGKTQKITVDELMAELDE